MNDSSRQCIWLIPDDVVSMKHAGDGWSVLTNPTPSLPDPPLVIRSINPEDAEACLDVPEPTQRVGHSFTELPDGRYLSPTFTSSLDLAFSRLLCSIIPTPPLLSQISLFRGMGWAEAQQRLLLLHAFDW